MKTFLHVGCGGSTKAFTTREFAGPEWHEVRLDIDPAVAPDIVGTITSMSGVADESVDAIFSSHNIEHLNSHEVPWAIAEFLRVLKKDGYAVITCPDLQSVAELVVQDRLADTAYISPAGPIAAIDMIYGFGKSIAAGNSYMAHRCGFTERLLRELLVECGFGSVASMRRPAAFDLWALASKPSCAEADLRRLAMQHFPG